jgi:coproporphyrinogen III oxidase-like Fe-S oxidoreductase
LENWLVDLQKASDLGIESIMCHALEVHPTKLAEQLRKGDVPPIGNGVQEIDMYLQATETLRKAGYIQWSLTHWMLPGTLFRYEREIRANNYDYLGLGLGSLSRIDGFVSKNTGLMSSYIDTAANSGLPVAGAVRLSVDDAMRSYVIRRLTGALSVKRRDFQDIFGRMPEDAYPDIISSLEKRGLINVDDAGIQLSSLGIVWAGKVCEEFCSKDFLERYEQSGWIQKHSIHHSSS